MYKRQETSTKVRSYTYDKSNRLKAETANGYTLEYAYNKDGTLCSETGGGVVKAYSYENGRVTGYIKSGDIARTEFEYDNYGNCTQYCKTPFSSTEIEWERGNLLKKIRNTEYEYNSSGLRFRKKTGSETTEYYYDGTKLLGENRNGEKEIRYIYDAEGISGFEIASEANPYMFVKDARNNVVAILDNGGEVAAYEYDAWGNCNVVKDTRGIGTLNPIRWKSQYYDSDSGFYYINNRFYSATTKQFLDGGSPETALANATTIYGLNPHNSTLTNPLSEAYNEYTIETATELAFDPPELTKWQSYWRSGWGKGLATALFVMATIATIAASIAFPIFAPEIWAGYAFAFGAVVVSLGIGALLAGFQSSQQGYGFWNGFVNYIRNNWAQEVAITSAIYIVALGLNTLRYSVANAAVTPKTVTNNKSAAIEAAKNGDYEALARLGTHNPESSKVMLGKFEDGGATSYIARAGNEFTYFYLQEWDAISQIVGKDNMWLINKAFLNQQIALGKTFYASHSIVNATGYFFYEINHLFENGLGIIQL